MFILKLKSLIFLFLLSGGAAALAHSFAPYPLPLVVAPPIYPVAPAPLFPPLPIYPVAPVPLFSPQFYLSIYNNYHQGPFYPLPPVNSCLPGQSSICRALSGQLCSHQYMVNYQPPWLSSCVAIGFIHICSNNFAPPQPVVKTACYIQNSPCSCAINFNGQWIYEPGWII